MQSAATVALMPLLIFYCVQWAGQPLPKMLFPLEGSESHLIHGSLVYSPIGISIGSATLLLGS